MDKINAYDKITI